MVLAQGGVLRRRPAVALGLATARAPAADAAASPWAACRLGLGRRADVPTLATFSVALLLPLPVDPAASAVGVVEAVVVVVVQKKRGRTADVAAVAAAVVVVAVAVVVVDNNVMCVGVRNPVTFPPVTRGASIPGSRCSFIRFLASWSMPF